jgi:hypothetical protein
MPTEAIRTVNPSPSPAAPEEWKGTARYQIVSCIGKGGMGVVY